MSAFGTKQTSPSALHMSAIGGKADIARFSPAVSIMPEKYRRPHNHERRQIIEDTERAWALSAKRWPRSLRQLPGAILLQCVSALWYRR